MTSRNESHPSSLKSSLSFLLVFFQWLLVGVMFYSMFTLVSLKKHRIKVVKKGKQYKDTTTTSDDPMNLLAGVAVTSVTSTTSKHTTSSTAPHKGVRANRNRKIKCSENSKINLVRGNIFKHKGKTLATKPNIVLKKKVLRK